MTRCTCGAMPPEDARFCHKCGRPLYEVAVEEEPEVAPPPPPVVESVLPEISFSNGLAIRVSLIAAGLAILVLPLVTMAMQALGPLSSVVVAAGSGFFSVFLYRRRSGATPSVVSGARLGWITGVFMSVVLLLLATAMIVLMTNQEFLAALRAQKEAQPQVEELLKLAERPEQLGLTMLLSLLVTSVTVSMMASVGGALGAKWLDGRQS